MVIATQSFRGDDTEKWVGAVLSWSKGRRPGRLKPPLPPWFAVRQAHC